MKIELSILKDRRVMLVGDRPFPDLVDHIEFYRDSKLAMIVYKNKEFDESILLEHEVPDEMVYPMEKNKDIIIFSVFPNHEPIGYKVPLVKVGDFR